MMINPNTAQRRQCMITSNTQTTIIVIDLLGDAAGYTGLGDTYGFLDYHLQNGSNALDRGDVDSASDHDFEGDARPGDDGLVDIGVDEAPGGYVPETETDPPVSRVLTLPSATVATTTLELN